MNKEIEVKVIGENFGRIRTELLNHGFKKIYTGHIVTHYLDFPDMRLAKNKQMLRIRKSGNEYSLGYKNTKKDSGISVYDEIETHIQDGQKALEIFKNIGLILSDTLDKTRDIYRRETPKIEIVFDKLHENHEDIPEYMEIEAETEELIHNLLSLLKIKKENIKPLNSHELIEYFRDSVGKK